MSVFGRTGWVVRAPAVCALFVVMFSNVDVAGAEDSEGDSDKPPSFGEATREDSSEEDNEEGDSEEENEREEGDEVSEPEGEGELGGRTESEPTKSDDLGADEPESDEPETDEIEEPDPEEASDLPEVPIESEKKWAVTAEVFTEIPFQLGGAAIVDTPAPVQLRGGIGYLPGPYMRTANDFLVGAFDGYGREDAKLVESTVKNSLLWQLGAGIVSGDNQGVYFAVGYTAATFGGTAASATLIEQATGEELPDRVKEREDSLDFDVRASLHQLDLELGLLWKFSHVSLRTGLGWSWTFASVANVDAQFDGDDERVDEVLEEIERRAEAHLDDTYRSYVHPPYLSIGIGFAAY